MVGDVFKSPHNIIGIDDECVSWWLFIFLYSSKNILIARVHANVCKTLISGRFGSQNKWVFATIAIFWCSFSLLLEVFVEELWCTLSASTSSFVVLHVFISIIVITRLLYNDKISSVKVGDRQLSSGMKSFKCTLFESIDRTLSGLVNIAHPTYLCAYFPIRDEVPREGANPLHTRPIFSSSGMNVSFRLLGLTSCKHKMSASKVRIYSIRCFRRLGHCRNAREL